MNETAPIVLFVYNRPDHTKKTLEALKKNYLAKDSDLYIYSDAEKDDSNKQKVEEVRKLIYNVKGFKSISIIEQRQNIGLAQSIIIGVTDIIKKHGRVIVLEDDIVTSPFFLTFMNKSLNFYCSEKRVWHISGWNYPIDTQGLGDTFLWRTMNCWGWATWSDRWQYFEKNSDKLINCFSKKDIRRFNVDGYSNFWEQVLLNKKNKINTWAVYWYATIFSKNGLCLNSSQSLVNNIGVDGSGSNCGNSDIYTSELKYNKSLTFEVDVKENELAISRIQSFYANAKVPFFIRVVNKLRKILKIKSSVL